MLVELLDGDARGDPRAVAVIVTALLPLVLARCRRDRDRVDDYVAELALVIATVDVGALRRSRRRAGGVLLDRAWDEVRRPVRRPAPIVPVDPADLGRRQRDMGSSVEDDAVARVTMAEVQAAVGRAAVERPWVVPAWNTAVELAERAHRDPVEARRWKYVREVLRRHVLPDVAA